MKRIRDAQTIIGALENGEVAAELSTTITGALKQLKEMCGNRPKAKAKGTVTLTLHLDVEQSSVTVEAEISQKLPKKPRGSSFYWVTDEGELSTEHPQQTDMFSGPRDAARAAG